MNALSPDEGRALAVYARARILAELTGDARPARPTGAFAEAPGATFVTLHRGARFHGCIGSLQAWRPLLEDVAHNAHAAAFEDPRAGHLDADVLSALDVEVSVLSEASPIPFSDEASARAALRPGLDGVVLRWGGHRGTFLPQVWESLPTPALFLDQLKRKAGLRTDFWAPDLVLERYTVQKFVDPAPAKTSDT
ncbi:AmmeMemoRadiSam system protein A [Myxococcota bacterium]|nr:AmmeMemoRadiSam system protein A [Myxococcota bacterium]